MPSEVRFTRAQKWDLVRISAAAVASTVFFTVPMFLVRPQPAATRIESRAAEPRVALAGLADDPSPRSNSPTDAVPKPSAPPVVDEPAVSVVTSTEIAVATTPAFRGSTPGRFWSGKPAQVRARTNTPTPDTPSLKRRLARFIAGDGKYNVKPFPTVSTSGS